MIEGARRVLESLHTAGHAPRSGEELSSQLGVSRAQIWKHVSALRKRGYSIDGAPGDGYRLVSSPDRLYPEEISRGLATRWLGRSIEHLDETDSTNRVAGELARDGAAHGTAVIAEAQTAGRGRLGRRLLLSRLLQPLHIHHPAARSRHSLRSHSSSGGRSRRGRNCHRPARRHHRT